MLVREVEKGLQWMRLLLVGADSILCRCRPTFRAEDSHTSRHLAEFWMIEPEIAYCQLDDCMRCAEDYVRHCCNYLLERSRYTRHRFRFQYAYTCLRLVFLDLMYQ